MEHGIQIVECDCFIVAAADGWVGTPRFCELMATVKNSMRRCSTIPTGIYRSTSKPSIDTPLKVRLWPFSPVSGLIGGT